MNTLEFLTSLRKADITIKVTQEGLQINAPSGGITESIKKELKIRKKEILQVLRETGKSIKTEDQEITLIARDQDLLLSPSQERVWSLTQLMPQNPSFNMHIAFNIEGPLDALALEHSLQEIIRRHEILRTTFSLVKGKPVQIISPNVTFTLTRVDLRKFDEHTLRSNIEQLANMEAREPFDLMQGPLVRGQLLEVNSHLHVFMVTMHHIISDGWSFFLFFAELAILYEDTLAHRKNLLPTLPIQYADFSNWHREWLTSEQCQVQVEYWQRELGNNVASLVLPLDRPRPAQPITEAGLQTRILPSSIVREITTSATYHGISINILFLTAFLVTLFKYSNQEDLVICSPVSGRDRDELKSLIGFFNNIVPIRLILKKDMSISELLEKVRIKTLDVLEHQDVPFHHLLTASNVGRVPLTRAMFDFQNHATQSLKLAGTTIDILDIHNGMTNFELSLTVIKKEENYKCGIEYKTALFDNRTIQGMLAYFETILKSITHAPAQKISAIPSVINKQQQEKYLKLEGENWTSGMSYVSPRDEIEQTIVNIWQEVLEIEKVGIHDNFFDLGGHSLLVTQVIGRLRHALQLDLSLRSLFDHPTLEEQAVAIKKLLLEETEDSPEDTEDDLSALLDTIDSMSEEEAQVLLEKERKNATD